MYKRIYLKLKLGYDKIERPYNVAKNKNPLR